MWLLCEPTALRPPRIYGTRKVTTPISSIDTYCSLPMIT